MIVSQNKANKDRLKNLNKAKQVFQGRLGLEIRKIHGKSGISLLAMAVIFYRLNILVLTQVLNHRIKRNCYSFIRGEKLQFIFRDINPKDSECVYTFMLRISEGGLYQSEYSK